MSSRQRLLVVVALLAAAACREPPPTPVPGTDQVVEGRRLFFEEAFDGNGRTCGTCHPARNNLTIDPTFVATLPPDDPLFIAETTPGLGHRFEDNNLIRGAGVILENLNGFADLDNVFTMRGVPHTLALGLSVASARGPRTGWSGDGAPGDGSLRAFATGAVIQHFTKTLNRVPGMDFRLPTDAELEALEAFQLALGRREELSLPLRLRSVVARRGQEIFNSGTEGKCSACHFNAGANGDPRIFGANPGNLNFDTGVEDLPDQPARLLGGKVPPDDGFGIPGDRTFNTPGVVEAADTGPFFHNNSVETIEGSVAFYTGRAFTNSPAGKLLVQATGSAITLDGTQVVAVAAFLRVINALENIRQSVSFLRARVDNVMVPTEDFAALPDRAADEINDAIMVLEGAGLHPDARARLVEARRLTSEASRAGRSAPLATQAIAELERARALIVETP